MNYIGLFHGIIVFTIIGVFHPLVIKGEYYMGRKSLILFCVVGVISLMASLVIENVTGATVLGVFAFCCFWSIKEVFEQEKRVQEGRFPRNPKRKY